MGESRRAPVLDPDGSSDAAFRASSFRPSPAGPAPPAPVAARSPCAGPDALGPVVGHQPVDPRRGPAPAGAVLLRQGGWAAGHGDPRDDPVATDRGRPLAG